MSDITREEAIKNLVAYAYYVDEPMPEQVAKSLDMAIEALNNQPILCKDCKHGREACGNIECSVDLNAPSEYHGYSWFCPCGERSE